MDKLILKDIRRAFRKAGIEDFRFHDLRHTFASHYQMATNDERTLRELLGHKNHDHDQEIRSSFYET